MSGRDRLGGETSVLGPKPFGFLGQESKLANLVAETKQLSVGLLSGIRGGLLLGVEFLVLAEQTVGFLLGSDQGALLSSLFIQRPSFPGRGGQANCQQDERDGC